MNTRILIIAGLALVAGGAAFLSTRNPRVIVRVVPPIADSSGHLWADSFQLFLAPRRALLDSLARPCARARARAAVDTTGDEFDKAARQVFSLDQMFSLDSESRAALTSVAYDSVHLSPAGFAGRIALPQTSVLVLASSYYIVGILPTRHQQRTEQVFALPSISSDICAGL